MRRMSEPSLSRVDRLVLQAIRASDRGTLFGAKKLQKLLFIAHHPQEFDLPEQAPLLALRFTVHRFGPHAEEVNASLERLRTNGLVDIETRDLTRAAAVPVSPEEVDEGSPPLQVRVYRTLPAGEEALRLGADADSTGVERAVEKWGWLTSEQIEQLALIRTGLTPALKARFAGEDWSRFEAFAGDERPVSRPEPPREFWIAQQQFFKERARLVREFGAGQFAAYIGTRRVLVGSDEVDVYKRVLHEEGREPDYIGFVSETGRQAVDALGAEVAWR